MKNFHSLEALYLSLLQSQATQEKKKISYAHHVNSQKHCFVNSSAAKLVVFGKDCKKMAKCNLSAMKKKVKSKTLCNLREHSGRGNICTHCI
jgi:hypothetical protein